MMLKRLWQRWGRTPTPASNSLGQDWGSDDHILSQPRVMAAILGQLGQGDRSVSVHGVDGRFIGQAKLRTCVGQQVGLRFVQTPPPAPLPSLNVVAGTPDGTILFSLKNCQPDPQGHWSAALAGDMIRMQSRDHYRLSGLHTRHPQVMLRLQDGAPALPVCNLSEQGLGLRLDTPLLQPGDTHANSRLCLNEVELAVPVLTIVHSQPARYNGWRVGVHMPDLPAAQSRTLRRWLDQAQTRRLG